MIILIKVIGFWSFRVSPVIKLAPQNMLTYVHFFLGGRGMEFRQNSVKIGVWAMPKRNGVFLWDPFP